MRLHRPGAAAHPGIVAAMLLLSAGCSTSNWCERFNLDCAVEAAVELTPAVDSDGDLWPDDTDCNDTDPESHPSASEICDGLDNDCDGEIDEGTPGQLTWYPDADGDGYGAETGGLLDCEGPTGWTTVGGDCEDSASNINPGMPEFCDEVDRNCDGDPELDARDSFLVYDDLDGDGFGDPETESATCEAVEGTVSKGEDCHDGLASVFPGADELCNLRDDDCDGEVDEPGAVDGEETGYLDGDGDGYGDDDTAVGLCGPAEGYTLVGGDCDDSSDVIHPGAAECDNGLDDDCDGLIDDDAEDAPAWYRDDDGDGYGVIAFVVYSCSQPAGYASDPRDCNDFDAAVNPDATEICASGDEDCDGVQGEKDPSLDTSTYLSWYDDLDGDGQGDPSSAAELACIGGPDTVDNTDDCDDSDATVYAGAPELCETGAVEDCDLSEAEAEAICALEGELTEHQVSAIWRSSDTDSRYLGGSVALAEDLDGDGVAELLIGDTRYGSTGAVHVVSGDASDEVDVADGLGRLDGDSTDGLAGTSVAWLGEWGDSGTIAVGASTDDYAAANGGAVYLFEGPVSGVHTLADEAFALVGTTSSAYAGHDLAVGGDLTGDGEEDLVLTALYDSLSASSGGAVYVFEGPVSSSRYLSAAEASMGGSVSGGGLGTDVAVGDLDGDGVSDLFTGGSSMSFTSTQAGAVWIHLGPLSGAISTGDGVRIDGESSYAGLSDVALLDDIDGDGLSDLLMGGWRTASTESNQGAAYVLLGPATSAGTVSSVAWASIYGATASDYLGEVVAAAGDADGDGLEDVLIAARGAEVAGVSSGAVYRFTGLTSGTWTSADATTTIGASDSSSLVEMALLGGLDQDGDGEPDMLLGASYFGVSGGETGGVLLYQVQDY